MKKLSFTLLLSLCAILAQSQTTAYLKVGNNGSFEKIEKVSTGGYITIGFDSAYKVQIIRWDINFNMVWKYKFNDANITIISPKIVEANDGCFYFMMASSEHTTSTWIVKFSSDGTLLWQKIYYLASGNLFSIALSKALPGDNGFLFGGGQCTLYNYIIKCAADGTIEWQHQYFYPLTTGVITCYSIIPDGTEYVVSSSYNINSLLTFMISATGAINSHTAYTYTGMQIVPIRIVKLKNTGGYAIVGGYNNSNDNKTEFVAIYSQSLSLISFNELTVTYTQFTLNDIAAINNGDNIVVNGSIWDGSAFTTIMINLSNTGSVVWKKRAAGNTTTTNKNVEFHGITENGNTTVHAGQGYNEGRVVAVIDNNGNGLCNDMQFDVTNVHRTLVMQSQTMSIAASTVQEASVVYTYTNSASYNKQIYCGNLSGIDDLTENQTVNATIYPNPASDKCVVSFGTDRIPDNTLISLYDISGKLVYKTTVVNESSETEIDLRGFTKGLYMVRITTENENLGNPKLVIMR
jgi:hypothetical protein